MSKDFVTFGLFSKQTGTESYSKALLEQKDNIKDIVTKFSSAATDASKKAPDFVLSVLLIPDWMDPANNYDSFQYNTLKETFLKEVRNHFKDIPGLVIQDFYLEAKLTDDEKAYMHRLKANGSNADIIKNRAIINNKDKKHLQLDTNTIIKDFRELYDLTFGASSEEQYDALNASFYDTNYVSAHNKIVYTTPTGKIADALEEAYLAYVKKFKDDETDKAPEKNSIYSKVFARALSDQVGLTNENYSLADDKSFFPACMKEPEYRITKSVATAINMSWAPPDTIMTTDELKKLPPLAYRDGRYDFQSFSYIVKKYCNAIPRSAVGKEDPTDHYQDLLNISDVVTDVSVLLKFYIQAIQTRPDLLKTLTHVIPKTQKGEELTKAVFNRTLDKLLGADPAVLISEFQNKQFSENIKATLVPALIAVDKAWNAGATRDHHEVIAEKVSTSITKNPPAQLKEFFMTLVSRNSESELQASYEKIEKLLPLEFYLKFLKQSERLLARGSDNKQNFNYIPNRLETIKTMIKLLELTSPDTSKETTPDNSKKDAIAQTISTLKTTLESPSLLSSSKRRLLAFTIPTPKAETPVEPAKARTPTGAILSSVKPKIDK